MNTAMFTGSGNHKGKINNSFQGAQYNARPCFYGEMYEKDKNIHYYVDELLNMSKEWKSLDEIHDYLCFQFGPFSLSVLEEIAEDLKNAGVIETRKG